MSKKSILLCSSVLCLFIFTGCETAPKGFLKPSENVVQNRQLEMRQYDTKDETKIITSVAGVLQDLGFTLDNSETQLGFVAASKKADATNGGQVAAAAFVDILSALGGGYSNASASVDKVQYVKACVIVKPSLDGNKIAVRVTFQRIVWNASNQINRVETISDKDVYQKFYDSLSKSIFLEAQQI